MSFACLVRPIAKLNSTIIYMYECLVWRQITKFTAHQLSPLIQYIIIRVHAHTSVNVIMRHSVSYLLLTRHQPPSHHQEKPAWHNRLGGTWYRVRNGLLLSWGHSQGQRWGCRKMQKCHVVCMAEVRQGHKELTCWGSSDDWEGRPCSQNCVRLSFKLCAMTILVRSHLKSLALFISAIVSLLYRV